MADAIKGMCFVEIHLRQWQTGQAAVKVRDAYGNEATLDGASHVQPHMHVLVELDAHDGVIDVPGRLVDYHPSNARPASETNPRKPHPKPLEGEHLARSRALETGSHDGGAAKPIGVNNPAQQARLDGTL